MVCDKKIYCQITRNHLGSREIRKNVDATEEDEQLLCVCHKLPYYERCYDCDAYMTIKSSREHITKNPHHAIEKVCSCCSSVLEVAGNTLSNSFDKLIIKGNDFEAEQNNVGLDLKILVGTEVFYTGRAVVSDHYSDIIKESVPVSYMDHLTTICVDAPAEVFKTILNYYVSGKLELLQKHAIDTYLYAKSVGIPVEDGILAENLAAIASNNDVMLASEQLQKISQTQMSPDMSKVFGPLYEVIALNAESFFNSKSFHTAPRNLLVEILRMDMDISELDLLKKVIEWGVVNCWRIEQNPITLPTIPDQLAETRKTLPIADKAGFSIIVEDGNIYVCDHNNNKVQYTLTTTKLRKFILDLLHYIRFEHLTVEVLVEEVEPFDILINKEFAKLCHASINVSAGRQYQVLGSTFQAGEARPKRIAPPPLTITPPPPPPPLLKEMSSFDTSQSPLATNEKKRPFTTHQELQENQPDPKQRKIKVEPLVERYNLSLAELKEKKNLNIRPFTYMGYEWYLRFLVPVDDRFLSLYLYNKTISDTGPLPVDRALSTKITFTIHNQQNENLKHVTRFERVWQKAKAWGFVNWIELKDFVDPKNGWLLDDGEERLDVSCEIESIDLQQSSC
ncbi:hypothetical protein AKO1_008125 [Acrasis kona]|uniref:BTB/POZ domain-containing protein n=1 Tax=Acrasis kona TaxID=1008807 RepID=A0AAW2YRI6_9EUKA